MTPSCPYDPDGLHHSGCGCEVDPINPNDETCPDCGHSGVCHDEDGQCWHVDDKGDEDCDCVRADGDLVHHELAQDCICGPTVEPVKRPDGSIGWVYVHHSLDHSLDNRDAAE